MKVLIACEESQTVCKAFREKCHDAYSCDVLECSGGHPEWHIQCDVLRVIDGDIAFLTCDGVLHYIRGRWDMIIAFPPCTYLTVTGNRWFDVGKYGDKAVLRYKKRDEAIAFFISIASANCSRIAIENPVGVMSTVFCKPSQIVNPFQFGDPFEKRTCLWLNGLPCLSPTNIVPVPSRKFYDSGISMPSWYADSWNLPKNERSRMRSKTFPGIARAMADQWG